MMNQKKISEQALIKGCIAGKPQFQKRLYDLTKDKMFGICLRYAKGYHNAEDILQDGYVKVYLNIHKFRGDGSFEGWMRRIMVNTAIEHYRRSVSMYPILEVNTSGLNEVEDYTLEKMAAEDLMAMVQDLSPGYRTVFNLYVVEGYPHKDIAKMLDISEGTSKSQLARARYILQDKIKTLRESEARKIYAAG